MKFYKTVTYEIEADSRERAVSAWYAWEPAPAIGAPIEVVDETYVTATPAIVQGFGTDGGE